MLKREVLKRDPIIKAALRYELSCVRNHEGRQRNQLQWKMGLDQVDDEEWKSRRETADL